MSISMEDVAQKAGVAKSTVSLVLNDRAGVSDEMRKRVQDAAAALGYRLPHRRPQEATPPSHAPVIALVHCVNQEPDIDPGLTHLYLAYRNGIQRFAQGQDISVMLITSYQDDDPESLGYQLLAEQKSMLDGLVLMGPGLRRDSHLIQRVRSEQIPTVILGRCWADLSISSVSQDHREQARLVVNHLFDLGHRHIGFVARELDRTYDWFHWRLKAYREVLGEKLGEDHLYVSISPDVNQAVSELLSAVPHLTAVFALNDHIAYQAMRAAVQFGRSVPGSLSVAGIDGTIQPQPDLPRLTTVTFPHEEVGYLAAELLIKQIRNKSLRNAALTVHSELVPGGSTVAPGE